jgi:hypothetical protein
VSQRFGILQLCRPVEERVSDANADFVPKCSTKSVLENLIPRLLYGFTASMLALVSLSCGTASHATLQISAPSTVVAGVPFSATVTAMYNGKRDTVINGPIHFTTSDTAAQLPTLYLFTAADAGSHTFTDLTLVTPGNQTMTVSDYDATPIAGTVDITVTAPPANQ